MNAEPTAFTSDSSVVQRFDFERHRLEAVDTYAKIRPTHENFSALLRPLLSEILTASRVDVASVEARAKSIDSLGEKAVLPSDTDTNSPKYSDPLTQITDLTGARIITFFPSTISKVESLINEQFQVLETIDKSAELGIAR